MQKFLQNRKAVAASIAALGAIGVAGYYLYTSSSSSIDENKKAKSSAKKKKSKKKAQAKKSTVISHGLRTKRDSSEAPLYPVIDDTVSSKSEQERHEIADELKAAGNAAFSNKQFDLALDHYNNAILVYDSDPVYYSNRAAVWGSLENYEKVIEDTTAALKLKPDYIKCYTRRAIALEQLKQYEESSLDYLSACILRNFEDESITTSVDRTIKLSAEEMVADMKKKPNQSSETQFPSSGFIKSYFMSHSAPVLSSKITEAADPNSGNYELRIIFENLAKETKEGYEAAWEHIQKASTMSFPEEDNKEKALLFELKSTFEYLLNDTDEAVKSINISLEIFPTVSAYLKRAVIEIELNMIEEAYSDFEKAREISPNSPDLFYQLGQLEFLKNDWDAAISDYKKCIELDPEFGLAYIQLNVSRYKVGQIEEAKKGFELLIKKSPEDSYAYNFYGELLLDSGDVEAAISNFDKAIELEQKFGDVNTLPMINKALALVTTASNAAEFDKALEICQEAEKIDPMSSMVVSTLAQLYLQRGEQVEAARRFERVAQIARSDNEIIQAMILQQSALLHTRVAKERPVIQERIELLTRIAAS